MKTPRDIEKSYSDKAFVGKLRRLADCIENGENFEIQVAGERIYVPDRFSISSMSAKAPRKNWNFRSSGRTKNERKY